MIVVDASAWVRSLVDGGPAGDAARRALVDDPDWAAPAHMPVEVLRTLRRYEASGLLTAEQASVFATEVGQATVRYTEPEPWLLAAIWARRHNVSPYDAGYLALAEFYPAPWSPWMNGWPRQPAKPASMHWFRSLRNLRSQARAGLRRPPYA